MADPGSRPAAGGSTEHLCQLSLGKWISGLNAHLVSRYRFVIYVISGIFPPEYYSRGFPARGRAAAQRDGLPAGRGYIALPPSWPQLVIRFRLRHGAGRCSGASGRWPGAVVAVVTSGV